MKSLLFKSAWSIFRIENVSFSVALKMAWEAIRQGKKVVIEKLNKLVKSSGLGYETVYFYKLTYANIETSKSVYNNDGASAYYDGKTFNND